MISRLSGTILEKDGKSLILDVGGVGYRIFVTNSDLAATHEGVKKTFFTHLAVREDSMNLYGFLSREELSLFELLITVSGIGPRSAISVLSIAGGDAVRRAVSSGETTYLTKVSGIGRKTAEKIIIELREKIGKIEGGSESVQEEVDAIEALRSLGYSQNEARDALKKIGQQICGAGNKVKAALKILGAKR
jgi:holliday junction DNA helicase RuvA